MSVRHQAPPPGSPDAAHAPPLSAAPSSALAICATCGTQFGPPPGPPASCPICQDERQYVGPDGQRWTTLAELRDGRHNAFTPLEPGLTAIRTEPTFAIGQRAFLIEAEGGNILWDCVSLVDDASVAAVLARGPVRAIAISHPHFYSSMVEWARALGGVPVWVHEADRRWVMRPDPLIRTWSGAAHELGGGLTLVHVGGHFAGAQALVWAAG
ncbi:MAG TPA: MBL fold metallo-hydrolase, partial [Polyangiaceae bacterium]|nr:MBL fold metallo-hydrolase [Polyangiaceae bacterium]